MELSKGQKVFIDNFIESWPAVVVGVGPVWTTIRSRVRPELSHLVPRVMRTRTGSDMVHGGKAFGARIVPEGMWAK